jgi:hypothetical protein
VVDPAEQSFDANGDVARRYAAAAMTEPVAFLDYDAVFPSALRDSERFRESFSESYWRVAAEGPIAAMNAQPAGEPR